MMWALVTVILGSFVYVISIIFKYLSFMGKTTPLIKQLKERIQKLEEGIGAERKLSGVLRGRVEEEKVGLTKLKLAVSEMEKKAKTALAHKEQLELEMYKRSKK